MRRVLALLVLVAGACIEGDTGLKIEPPPVDEDSGAPIGPCLRGPGSELVEDAQRRALVLALLLEARHGRLVWFGDPYEFDDELDASWLRRLTFGAVDCVGSITVDWDRCGAPEGDVQRDRGGAG